EFEAVEAEAVTAFEEPAVQVEVAEEVEDAVEEAEAVGLTESVETLKTPVESALGSGPEALSGIPDTEQDYPKSLPLIETINFPSQETQKPEDLLEEVEFELFLSTLDLSVLDGWNDEEGFLDFDLAVVRYEVREEEPDELPLYVDELEVPSEDDRDHMEELPVYVSASSYAKLEPLVRASTAYEYIPFDRRTGFSVRPEEGELYAVGEAEPREAEYLEGFSGEEAAGGISADGFLADAPEAVVYQDGVFTVNQHAADPGFRMDPSLAALADEVLGRRS
ncbi:MAG TPA: hypothetical protein VLH39_05250, partial [Magnetospirillaceae bacterium]|nr:hypothetical protein [Magnetospirillaceae bacterium]